MYDKKYFMNEAIKEASKACGKNEVPIGAVIVYQGKIIARAHNQKEKRQNVLSHAELIAVEKASKKRKNWRLDNCEIYVTLEPCPMCASAIQQARISKVYYALGNTDKTLHEAVEKIFLPSKTNPGVQVFEKIYSEDYKNMLQDFFKNKRI